MSDLSRYARQIVLREVGVAGQSVLRDSSVLVLGLGGLGSAAAQYLAAAGVGRLVIADRDVVDLSNLQRQILYAQSDVGRAKPDAAADRLRALNREMELELCKEETWRDAVARVDVVLDCSDNFPTRFDANERCVRARKPLVSGAAIRFEGQLAVFDARRGDSPCYACLYPQQGDVAETCEEAGVLGPTVGVIGSLQALAALKLLLGIGDDVGKLHLWNAIDMSFKTTKIPRDPRCTVCHG
ncbi:MAG TPA: molybdopterin-synthase adenylyltransferase MoeB [Nevskiaceae bacterium]|nr:molybdopterin-synthase adenylyltransferase MoeB [Nevskiaceae bacterium]